ncbi:MAG TPA: type II CRISPR-associated endonuclease Cas1 [Candidatus Bathyarchaeia archaeon]|nr:type II CRISPR-associated endonuclease Cas1 [Candidatus Bathyarchaeia archaeon]
MTERIIDLSFEPARLHVSLERLVIVRNGQDDAIIPLAEVGVLLIAHRQVSLTHAVLSGISANGGVIVACDQRFMPVGMMLPVEQHHLQAERFLRQAQAPAPLRKRLWRQIVRAKIKAQARLLVNFRKNDFGLAALRAKVRSGDPENVEAQAARRYWPALFDSAEFKRNREAQDQNRLLNYGYGVLRAVIARAVCAAGLHPSLGLHHHNRYDAFCLADDLMEPFRVIVDRAVLHIVLQYGPQVALDRSAKAPLTRALFDRIPIEGESRSVFDAAAHTASSLASVYCGETKNLLLPDL